MKQLIIIFILLPFITGCDEDNSPPTPSCDIPDVECRALPAPINDPGPMLTGRVDGLKNCLPFTATAYSYVGPVSENLIGLGISTYDDWGFFLANKETISIGVAAHQVGTYPFLKNDTTRYIWYNIYQDHDVAEDVYNIDTTFDNFMVITSIDTINDHITGWFDCRFVVYPPASGKSPDTIMFTDCHFDARAD